MDLIEFYRSEAAKHTFFSSVYVAILGKIMHHKINLKNKKSDVISFIFYM